MAKRRVKIKLSKMQIVENERNKWLARRDAAIAMLVKSMGQLVKLDRSGRRLQKAELKPQQQKIVDAKQRGPKTTELMDTRMNNLKDFVERGQTMQADVNAILDAGERQSTEERMRAAGFRPTRKRKGKAQSALTS